MHVFHHTGVKRAFSNKLVASHMIFGVIVTYTSSTSSIYSWIIWCDLQVWIHYIGYVTIVTTTLFCMLYRVHKVAVRQFCRNTSWGRFVAAQVVAIGLLLWYRIIYPPKITTIDDITVCDYGNEQAFFILLQIGSIYILRMENSSCERRNRKQSKYFPVLLFHCQSSWMLFISVHIYFVGAFSRRVSK